MELTRLPSRRELAFQLSISEGQETFQWPLPRVMEGRTASPSL